MLSFFKVNSVQRKSPTSFLKELWIQTWDGQMQRRIRIIITAIVLAIIGAIVPMIVALYLAWSQAINNERLTLYEYSTRMLQRAQMTLNEARGALLVLENYHENRPCSSLHIKWLNDFVISLMGATVITYSEDGLVKCSNNGLVNTKMLRPKSDFILPDGLELSVETAYHSDFPVLLLSMRKDGNYDLYADSKRLSDIIVPESVWLSIVFQGKIVTEQHPIDLSVFKNIFRQVKQEGLSRYLQFINGNYRLKPVTNLRQDYTFFANNMLVSISRYGPFYFIAAEPEVLVYERYKKLQYILLPFGFITAAFIVGLVIYYSNKRLSFSAEMREALRNQEFIVYYQPISDVLTGKCCGAEALVRWRQPNGHMVPPDLFIPYAEESGLACAITDRVIEKIKVEMESYLVQNRNFHISINVAADDIQSGRIITVLETKLAKSKILKSQIWIELTERIFLEAEKAKITIQKARTLGYIIAIDDFGTGFSSLSYLQHLPLDILKIDKSFIDSLGMHSATSNVTDHIIDMAKSLHLRLLAEGVEKQTQYEYLKERNVDYVQGYFYAKPLPLNEFMKFISS